MFHFRRSILGLLLALPILAGCGPVDFQEPTRAVWITRWDYLTEQDVRRVVADCTDAGFNELIFQVRGNATTFYPSRLEPWAEQFNWQDPGFDPLGVALEEAHARGVRLHAWVNVVPAWWGSVPPADREHVVNRHPEWLWYDSDGGRQPSSEKFYLSLNPCLPEVRTHIRDVLTEIVAEYEVDGVHLDYLRFPNEKPAVLEGSDYPRDARTLELYAQDTGKHPDDDQAAWDAWRCEQITRLLREIGTSLRRTRPAVEISAAVGSELEGALHHFQNWQAWIDEGLVDAIFPMNYTGDEERFRARMEDWRSRGDRLRVVMGLHATSTSAEILRRRMSSSIDSFDGYSLFGYLYLWDSRNNVIDEQTPERRVERAELRRALLPLSGATASQ